MKMKYKLLNKLADLLSDYRTPNYDTILSFDVKGKVKGVLTTDDCSYTKELKDKEQYGIISVDKLLDNIIGDSKHNDIYFCDKDNVICICNHSKDCYVEPVYEYFDSAKENVYLVCDSDISYASVKGYISQNSKYHKFLSEREEVPNKKAFNKLFVELDKTDKEENINYIKIKGNIFNIGREFKKKMVV